MEMYAMYYNQKWKRKKEGGESEELVCHPCIKDQNWLKKIVINKKVYPFHLRTKKLTDVPYRLQIAGFQGAWFMN
jgi:hypothetical protein